MKCLKDKLISDSLPSVPASSSIPVEVEVIPEPPLESPLEPETNPVIPTPSSRTCSFSIPENPDAVLEGSDKEAEHLEAQAQALRDYQLARDRVCRVPILTGSRTARSDRDWPPGLSVGVSPI
ncbi:hypothetical protein M9H77_06554 [Catharanthus roseus]|uniref:Uncharacterized protein n=1 Tax=Catharanthus roseus TaxID=4058 RepID=A0ACC0BSG0_CATRO|nr:hypothetical protein M9H77_06554 [Catharanthus roseus]